MLNLTFRPFSLKKNPHFLGLVTENQLQTQWSRLPAWLCNFSNNKKIKTFLDPGVETPRHNCLLPELACYLWNPSCISFPYSAHVAVKRWGENPPYATQHHSKQSHTLWYDWRGLHDLVWGIAVSYQPSPQYFHITERIQWVLQHACEAFIIIISLKLFGGFDLYLLMSCLKGCMSSAAI